jgi:hypothetical protein
MDVQVGATGRRFYKIDDAIAMILIDAGIVRPLHAPSTENPPAQPPPQKDTFAIAVSSKGEPMLVLTRPSGETVRTTANPKDAAAAFKQIGAPVPKEILTEYERQFPQNAEWVLEQKRLQIQQAQQKQNEHDNAGHSRW